MTNTNQQVSVDCVIFGFDFEKLNVLLLERCLKDDDGKVVFCDNTLVGHHIKTSESLEDAAARVLEETTGLTDIYLEQFHTFSNLDRLSGERNRIWLNSLGFNPDARVITSGYFSLVNIDQIEITKTQRNAKWREVSKVGQLGFDHNIILEKALAALRSKMKSVTPMAFELLPQKFTLSQLQKLYEVVHGFEIDKRNFRKKATQSTYIVGLNEKQQDFSNKPAQLFMFSREIYEATRKQTSSINF